MVGGDVGHTGWLPGWWEGTVCVVIWETVDRDWGSRGMLLMGRASSIAVDKKGSI